MPYVPNAILFDGTTDFMVRGGDLSGVVDSKTGIFSTWIRLDGGDGTNLTLLAPPNLGCTIRRVVPGFQVRLENGASTVISTFHTGTNFTAGPDWIHIIAAWDLATLTTQFFANDISDKVEDVGPIDDLIDYVPSDWGIGGAAGGEALLIGAMADFFFAPGQFLDLTTVANRRKFIDAAGNPVFLGVSGEEPTGSPASIYLRGNRTDQGINSGTGGDFVSQATQVPGETTGPVANATSSASGLVNGPMFHELESAAGYITGPAFRLGSNKWTNQFVAPDTLCALEGSNDKLNWRIVADNFNRPISALADVMRVGGDRTTWLRFVVATDAMEPRLFTAIIQNQKLLEEGR